MAQIPILQGRQANRGGAPQVSAVKKLKLLVTIVNKNKAEFYIDYLQSFGVNLQLLMHAHGTAGSEMLHYMGLEESEKTILLSLVREDFAPQALAGLDEKFRLLRGGKGIAYTVPLTGVIGAAIYQFLSNQTGTEKENFANEI
ncbi:MAG: hypothetical protein E7680_01835 [Ruminococcaceae bacterium]|nr:hypothetical protein [Oscillospiraceae bacterium]